MGLLDKCLEEINILRVFGCKTLCIKGMLVIAKEIYLQFLSMPSWMGKEKHILRSNPLFGADFLI